MKANWESKWHDFPRCVCSTLLMMVMMFRVFLYKFPQSVICFINLVSSACILPIANYVYVSSVSYLLMRISWDASIPLSLLRHFWIFFSETWPVSMFVIYTSWRGELVRCTAVESISICYVVFESRQSSLVRLFFYWTSEDLFVSLVSSTCNHCRALGILVRSVCAWLLLRILVFSCVQSFLNITIFTHIQAYL